MSDSTDFSEYHSVAGSFDPTSSPTQSLNYPHNDINSTSNQSNEDISDSIPSAPKVITSKDLNSAQNLVFSNDKSISGERSKTKNVAQEKIVADFDASTQALSEQTEEKSSVPLKRDDDFLDDDFFVIGGLNKKKKKPRKQKKTKKESPETTTIKTAPLSRSNTESSNVEQLFDDNSSSKSEPQELSKKSARYLMKTGSLTPPPILDATRMSKYPSPKLIDRELNKLSQDFEQIKDDSDDDIQNIEKRTVDLKPADPFTYTFDDASEKRRPYIFKVVSKIPGRNGVPLGASLDFTAKGNKKFGRIFESVLTHFKANLRLEPIFQAELYTTEQTSFIWVEGKTEIRPFYKPSTLRVPPPVDDGFNFIENPNLPQTFVTILLIPRSHSKEYLHVYPEFNKSNRTLDQVSSLAREIEQLEKKERHELLDDDDESLLDDQEIGSSVFHNDLKPDLEAQGVDGYFVIGLKGADNKRVEVQVSHETPIKKLLSYYLSVKKIDEASINLSKAKLIFDDEPLDMNGLVGDTELEEEFEVQIVI